MPSLVKRPAGGHYVYGVTGRSTGQMRLPGFANDRFGNTEEVTPHIRCSAPCPSHLLFTSWYAVGNSSARPAPVTPAAPTPRRSGPADVTTYHVSSVDRPDRTTTSGCRRGQSRESPPNALMSALIGSPPLSTSEVLTTVGECSQS